MTSERFIKIDPIEELLKANVMLGLMSPRTALRIQAMVDFRRKQAAKD